MVKKEIIIMGKKIEIPIWTILLTLVSLILSITVYAYTKDNVAITNSINENKQAIDSVKKTSIEYTDKSVQALRNEIHVQYTQIQTDLTIIKTHLINEKQK